MPDPQTPNLQLYIPLSGADPGTWDVPMNANYSALDAALGQTATIPVTNASVVLSPAQYACGTIIVTGIQTADLGLIFPAFGRMYNVLNLCSNSTTFVVFIQHAAPGAFVCAPPGEMVSVATDGTGFRYLGLEPHVGGYWDYAGATVPRWISSCSTPPFLNCDGSAFAPLTYPVLNAVLGGAVLPDLRGRARYTLNQGTARLNAINGNVIFSAGGANTIAQANLPNYTLPDTLGVNITDPTHFHDYLLPGTVAMDTPVVGDFPINAGAFVGTNTSAKATGITAAKTGTVTSGGSGTAFISPSIVSGITMIRAA